MQCQGEAVAAEVRLRLLCVAKMSSGSGGRGIGMVLRSQHGGSLADWAISWTRASASATPVPTARRM